MKIAFDATAIPANRAGAGNYIFQLVYHLAKMDHENQYFVFAKPNHIEEFRLYQPNFHFIRIDSHSIAHRLLWEQTGLPELLRMYEVDLLHSPHYTMPLRMPCKSVVTFHDMTFFLFPEVHTRIKRLWFRAMMRRSARRADKLIAVSESTRLDMIRWLNIAPNRVSTVHEAASTTFCERPAQQVEEVCARYRLTPGRYVYYVGVLEPRKNVPRLIEAYGRLAPEFPDVPLVIAGKKGWMYDEIFRTVVARGLQDRVRFLGYVPQDDLAPLYNGARVFAYPSRYEGFGLPILEAMQCGTPVITTSISSMPELAGNAALLVDPNDSTSLATALYKVLTDDHLVESLTRLGITQATHFSWNRCALETLAVYRSLGC